jgi:hypothetical protein
VQNYFSTDLDADKLRKLQKDVQVVQTVMQDNIGKELWFNLADH